MLAKKNSLFCLSLILSASLYGQSAPAAGDGIYSADQAHRGEAMYKTQCTACHGDALDGVGPYPPLSGDEFLSQIHRQARTQRLRHDPEVDAGDGSRFVDPPTSGRPVGLYSQLQ